jgi:hypothetical protein
MGVKNAFPPCKIKEFYPHTSYPQAAHTPNAQGADVSTPNRGSVGYFGLDKK